MKSFKKIVILCGGESGESRISLSSGQAVYDSLKKKYNTELIKLSQNILPESLNPEKDFIFPMIHGDFGEDGALQELLDKNNFSYIGSGKAASEICIHKMFTKQLANKNNLPFFNGKVFQPGQILNKKEICNELKAEEFVLKPENKGSSLGLCVCKNFTELQNKWNSITDGLWLIESYANGKELTVGILHGKAMGVVEIVTKNNGLYDYNNKYTAGSCEYIFPAKLHKNITKNVQNIAEKFFKLANCKDYARADFILKNDQNLGLLEFNTIPGMTSTSLFPKSAMCVGLDFDALLIKIIEGHNVKFY